MTFTIIALAVMLSAVWLVSVVKLGEFWSHCRRGWPQLHHSYYGQALVTLGLTLGHSWLTWLGLAVLLDDAFQHAYQWLGNRPEYRSPLHLLSRYTVYWLLNV